MSATTAPNVLWAQRSSDFDAEKNILYVTINASDLQPGHELTLPSANKLHFKGTSKAADGTTKDYAFDLDLFGEVDTEAELKPLVTGKHVFVVLKKKELKEGALKEVYGVFKLSLRTEYWPRLSKDKRVNYIKTNFDLWRDQDEQDDASDADAAGPGGGMPPGMDFGGMGGMGGMPGMPGLGGMPGMGGAGGMEGMDMEKLMAQMGGAGGLGGLGGASGAGDAPEEDDDDDDMPPLESSS